MITDKERKKFKQQADILKDAYSEILQVLHTTNHHSAMKAISEVIYPLNVAIKDLEEASKDDWGV